MARDAQMRNGRISWFEGLVVPPLLDRMVPLANGRSRAWRESSIPSTFLGSPMFCKQLIGSLSAAIALSTLLPAQQAVVTFDTSNDVIMAFSPVDGSLISASLFEVPNTVQVSAIMVNNEIWVSEQTGDRVVRYDVCGNELGVIGPSFAGGGLDNIRGMNFIGGIVYVCNDGSNNGATADSLVAFDAAGNYLQTLPLSDSVSPFSVVANVANGNLLVAASSAEDVHEYTTAGVSVGTFQDANLGFAHHLNYGSGGTYWLTTFTGDDLYHLDATGAILTATSVLNGAGGVDNPRGVYELQNGNLLWTNTSGVHVLDVVSMTSTLVQAGSCYHLNEVSLDFACHKRLGTGCHSFRVDNSNHFELFLTVADAKAALDDNAIQYILNGNGDGYDVTWISGVANAIYVPPSASANIIADASTTNESFTPSAPIPIAGGVATTWTVSSEGILTAAATGNQGTDTTASLNDVDETETGLAWYTWVTQNPTETGSGKIKWEEVGTTLYVTFDGVELSGGSPTQSPSTYQWQIDMTTGSVLMLWPSFSASSSTADVLVGCTLAGGGAVPVSQTLSTAAGYQLVPDDVLSPLTLTGSPNPVINPSTLVTYTASNAPEYVPGSGVYIGTMFLSFTPLPGGVDLTGILANQPGCSAYIGSLDLALSAAVSATPDLTWDVDFSNTLFFPGANVSGQAIALFDGGFPLLNGEDGGLVFSNGLTSTTYAQ